MGAFNLKDIDCQSLCTVQKCRLKVQEQYICYFTETGRLRTY